MSDRRRPDREELKERLHAAARALEAELAAAAFRLRSEIAERKEKSVEKASPHFGPKGAAAQSYRRWRRLPLTQRATALAIRELELKKILTISERETLLRLRKLQMEDER